MGAASYLFGYDNSPDAFMSVKTQFIMNTVV